MPRKAKPVLLTPAVRKALESPHALSSREGQEALLAALKEVADKIELILERMDERGAK